MRLLVFGPRTWNDRPIMEAVLVGLHHERDLTIIEGGAKGADRMAGAIYQDLWAGSLFTEIAVFEADWRTHGRAAGPIRNRRMIAEGRPEEAVGFVHGLLDGLPDTPGSRNMAEQLLEAGVPTFYVVAPPLPEPERVRYSGLEGFRQGRRPAP